MFLKTEINNRRILFIFLKYFIQHCFICRLPDSTVSEGTGIESSNVASLALAVRPSNHSDRSHPCTTRLDIIYIRLDLIHSGNKYAFIYIYIYLYEMIPNPSTWIIIFEGIIPNHHSLVNSYHNHKSYSPSLSRSFLTISMAPDTTPVSYPKRKPKQNNIPISYQNFIQSNCIVSGRISVFAKNEHTWFRHRKSHKTFVCKIYITIYLLYFLKLQNTISHMLQKIEFLQWLPPIAVSMHSR
jgi:hypothetical protein